MFIFNDEKQRNKLGCSIPGIIMSNMIDKKICKG